MHGTALQSGMVASAIASLLTSIRRRLKYDTLRH